MMIKAPDHVLKVKPYIPGKPIEELERELGIKNAVKLASNENPLGPSKLALKAIHKFQKGVNRYPDGAGFYLKEKLSSVLKVKPESLILGNGSNELLDMAVKTFMRPGDHAVMATPSFVVYPLATTLHGARPIEVPLKDWRHDLAEMARKITPKTKIVFIANPNNPTGTMNTDGELRSFLKKVPDDILVILDEAYYEYVTNPEYPDSMKYLKQGRNLLILRTFSKIYGLAGLRIGYGIGHPELLLQMERVREPFNTGMLSQTAALAALDDKAHVENSKKLNAEGKKFLYREFSALGLKFVPTEANFIFAVVPDAAGLYQALLRDGVIIRPMGMNSVRITIGLPNENRKLVRSLKKLLK